MKAVTFRPVAGAERRESRFLSGAVAAQAKGGLHTQHNRHAPKGEVTVATLSHIGCHDDAAFERAPPHPVLREMSPTGAALWSVGLARRFNAVNKVAARQSIMAAGPTIAGGMLFIGSGYSAVAEHFGNVLT